MGKNTRLDEALTTFSRSFATGDGETFVGLFTKDAKALLHEEPALVGAAAIRDMFMRLFAKVDTAGFEVYYDTIDVQGDRAYVLASFRETLRPKDGTSAIRVDGRILPWPSTRVAKPPRKGGLPWPAEPTKLTGRRTSGPDLRKPIPIGRATDAPVATPRPTPADAPRGRRSGCSCRATLRFVPSPPR